MDNNNNNTYLFTGGQPDASEGEGVIHVIAQDGVSSIDDETFSGWEDLVSIHIPSSVTRIGENAFWRCTSLLSITLPTSLQHIEDGAFALCTSLSVIDLPDSLIDIGEGAFYGCEFLPTIVIPPSITTVQEGTFCDCTSLSEITIPQSVIEIGEVAFNDCVSLKSVKLPTGIQQIGYNAYSRCTSLESIQIPTTTTSVRDWAFSVCSSLRVTYIPSSSTHESRNIFYHCNPTNLIILTDVDGFDYGGCEGITLHNIHQCIQDLPNDAISINEQLDTLHQVFHQRFPAIANKAQESGFNLLHLLIYFPGNIYESLSTLLTKCPQATTAIDWKGKTPLHRAIESTKHNMHSNSYNLLLRHSPDTVVHQAIRAGLYGNDLYELVKRKVHSLTMKDVSYDERTRGLLPFMMAAESSIMSEVYEGKVLLSMTISYELLSMNPSVLQDYIVF